MGGCDDAAIVASRSDPLYDGSGNIRAIGGQRYRYDGVSRLMEAELRIPETSATLFGVESFTYDAYGNLTSRETTEGGSTTVTNTPADATTNRLSGATSYDSEGNLTSWNGAQYGFDALGRMVRMRNGAEDWLFAYSSGGERVLQVDQGGAGDRRWTVRDVAGRVLREWVEPSGGSPAWDRDWIYRGQNLLATVDATTTRHLTLDHLGTPRLVTDPSGAKLAFKAFWPYGREATDPNQDTLSKKFTGHERDAYDPSSTADDLDYMHARFANPTTGRFLSVDPVRGSRFRPQTFNRFSYVGGNPVAFTDPSGRFMCSVFGLGCPTTTFYESITVTPGINDSQPPDSQGTVIWHVNWGSPGDDDIDGGDDSFPGPGGGGGGGGGGNPKPAPPAPDPDDPNDDPDGPNENPFTEAVLEAFAERADPCGNTFKDRFNHRMSTTNDVLRSALSSIVFGQAFGSAFSHATGAASMEALAGRTATTAVNAWRAGLTYSTVIEASLTVFSQGLPAAAAGFAQSSAAGLMVLEAGVAVGSAMGATSSCLGH